MSEPSDDIIDCLARMKGDNQPFALATVVRTEDLTSAKAGAKAVIRADGSLIGWIGGGCTLGAVRQAAASALADGRARLLRVRPRPADEPAPEGMEFHKSHCPSGGTVEVSSSRSCRGRRSSCWAPRRRRTRLPISAAPPASA